MQYGATIIIEEGGALDLSGEFDYESVIKTVGQPPASETDGSSDGKENIPTGDTPDDDSAEEEDEDGDKEKASTGTIAGIVAGLALVFIVVNVIAVLYTKRQPMATHMTNMVVNRADNQAFGGLEGESNTDTNNGQQQFHDQASAAG